MMKFRVLALLLATQIAFLPAFAGEIFVSSKNEIFENPFIVIGYNKETDVVTGSISATRTAPGQTDECRVLFSGHSKAPSDLTVRYFEVAANENVERNSVIDKAAAIRDGADVKLILNKKGLSGDCEWILPFIGEPRVKENHGKLYFSIPKLETGDWIAVHTVKSVRASFYKVPDAKNAEKAFLVAGDTVYVYEERQDWYYVKYQGRKKQTLGWIKKSDTVQF
jgi:hypothetical protein